MAQIYQTLAVACEDNEAQQASASAMLKKLEASVTLAATLDLAFNVDGSARLHASLKHRVYALLAQAEEGEIPIEKLREQAALVYADEPPCMHAVNAVAYNGAMLASGRPEKYLFKIGWWHRFWRNVFAFASAEFKTYEEIELEKRASSKSA